MPGVQYVKRSPVAQRLAQLRAFAFNVRQIVGKHGDERIKACCFAADLLQKLEIGG